MTITYTDKNNISLPLAVYLCHDKYDHSDNPRKISATALLKPIREQILSRRMPDKEIEISDLLNSRMGTSIHDGAEEAWRNPKAVKAALNAKGIGHIEDRIIINPTEEELSKDNSLIPVYLENRSEKEVNSKYSHQDGWIITGKYDIVYNGQLFDYKSCSVWNYIYGSKVQDYIWQGSIYRWLNPDKITKDSIEIGYIFTDWSSSKAREGKGYPPERYIAKNYKLKSIEETESFIKNQLYTIDKHLGSYQYEIPRCTDEEVWKADDMYKYYKNPDKLTRSTANFPNNKLGAYQRLSDEGVGIVIETKGKVKRCKYCSALNICSQASEWKEQNMLQLD